MDYAATTPIDPRVRKAMEPFWIDKFGNPSSIHSYGQEALDALENARKITANLIGAKPSEIVFTSSGTEGDNAAIQGICHALKDKGKHIITTVIEHHAVLRSCQFLASQGFDVTYVPVNRQGLVDPDDIKKAITDRTILITVMHANNEIGTLQPISEIGAMSRAKSIIFHTDAVQTFGHYPIDINQMNVDLLSISAHKFYGPKGVGALYIRDKTPFVSLIHGGAQEQGRRSSTHNIPGIVGLAKAAEIAHNEMSDESKTISNLRKQLLDQIFQNIGQVHLNGHKEKRLYNNINISFENVEGEALIMNLDLEGIAASSGSACSSGSDEASHVLLALGLPLNSARGSLRLTMGRFTTEKEINYVAEVLSDTVSKLRALSPFV
jgi:cysteine desulfurase